MAMSGSRKQEGVLKLRPTDNVLVALSDLRKGNHPTFSSPPRWGQVRALCFLLPDWVRPPETQLRRL